MNMEPNIVDTEEKSKGTQFDRVVPQQGREGRGILVAYQRWRGLACPPSRLKWGTMAAPIVQLPSNL